MVQQQYEVQTEVRVAIDALDYEYNHGARTQSTRLSAARLQLAVGRRGLGTRDQEEQRTQRASVVATYRLRIIRGYTHFLVSTPTASLPLCSQGG